ncbi:Alpha-mannosidase 2x, partial [Coemansia asiatica]
MEIQAETETGGDRLSVDSSDSGDSLGSIEQQRVDTEYKPQSLKGTVGCEPNATIYHVLAGLLVGCLFIYFIEQKVDINRLDGWTIGQGHVFWLLVLPTSITAYVISGAMRWTSRQTTLFICSLAVGIVLTIFGMPSWQSRPLALSSSAGTELARKHGWLAKNLLKFEVEHGSLCDTARIWIDHQTEVTYSLCADKPSYVQVTTMLSADVNREVVAQFEIEQPFAATVLSERLFGCQFDIFNGVDVVRRQYNWWTPIPGNYYPAISHVSLLTNPRGDRHRSGFFTLHSRQAMGATCIKHNTIETMLHRSMSGNDFRGLVDPMVDNVPATITQFLDL